MPCVGTFWKEVEKSFAVNIARGKFESLGHDFRGRAGMYEIDRDQLTTLTEFVCDDGVGRRRQVRLLFGFGNRLQRLIRIGDGTERYPAGQVTTIGYCCNTTTTVDGEDQSDDQDHRQRYGGKPADKTNFTTMGV